MKTVTATVVYSVQVQITTTDNVKIDETWTRIVEEADAQLSQGLVAPTLHACSDPALAALERTPQQPTTMPDTQEEWLMAALQASQATERSFIPVIKAAPFIGSLKNGKYLSVLIKDITRAHKEIINGIIVGVSPSSETEEIDQNQSDSPLSR